jgi:membrane protease YdiL (CAAX protease family)
MEEDRTAASGAIAPPRALPAARLVRLALVFYGLLLGVAVLWRGLGGGPLGYASAEAAARGLSPLRDTAAGLAAALVLVVASRQWSARTRAGAALSRALAAALQGLGPGQILVLALSSGIAEEAFFRGALQPAVGLVAASGLFGLAHLAPRRELWSWAPASALAGLALGALFETTGNLLAPVVAHVAVNALNLRWLIRA